MNTQAIAEYLYNAEKSISFVSELNGHPVLTLRTGIDRVIVVGDTYDERETLKAAGYRWNAAEKLWEKNLPADQDDTLIFNWCFDRKVYTQVAMQMVSLNMGRYTQLSIPANIRFIESDLKWVFEQLNEIKTYGLVEHD